MQRKHRDLSLSDVFDPECVGLAEREFTHYTDSVRSCCHSSRVSSKGDRLEEPHPSFPFDVNRVWTSFYLDRELRSRDGTRLGSLFHVPRPASCPRHLPVKSSINTRTATLFAYRNDGNHACSLDSLDRRECKRCETPGA